MDFIRNSLFTALFLICPLSLFADASSRVTARVVSECEVVRPGSTFWAAVTFKVPTDVHLYWKNPGSVGAPPKLSWTLPSGWQAGEPLFPAPSRIEVVGTVIYGYSQEFSLLVPITSSPSSKIGEEVTLDLEVSWLACGASCVPGSDMLKLTVEMAASDVENSNVEEFFEACRQALPQPRSQLVVEAKNNGTEIQIPSQNGPYQDIKNVVFFPEKQGIFDPAFQPKWRLSENMRRLIVELPTKEKQDAAGVVRFSYKKNGQMKDFAFQVLQEVPEGKKAVEKIKRFYEIQLAQIEGFFTAEFAIILFFAFIGGLLLNVMPCVLPIVSLKVLHFVKMAGQGRWVTFKHGALFSLGVLVCFWGLAFSISIFQAFGKTIGWGFQLQEPLFVAFLLVILFILSLSLFGLFEFGTKIASIAAELDEVAKAGADTKEDSPTHLSLPSSFSSFFSGILATFVASPCTGPLLGSTIGFTATLSPMYAFIVFTMLGLGMAFPYLLLSLFPASLKLIPRPGRWMVTFKQLMGFFLLGTVLWLIWVLNAETENLSMIVLTSSFFLIAFGLWIYGTWGGFDRKSTTRAVAKFFALSFVLFGVSILMLEVYQARKRVFEAPQVIEKEDIPVGAEWEPFSLERLDALQQKGIPVYVEFSAKWCLICRANALVLDSKAVQEAFVKYGVVKMYADWTLMDDKMTQVMRGLGRNGVPIHVLYSKDRLRAPEIFPELITQEMIIDALKRVHEEKLSS